MRPLLGPPAKPNPSKPIGPPAADAPSPSAAPVCLAAVMLAVVASLTTVALYVAIGSWQEVGPDFVFIANLDFFI